MGLPVVIDLMPGSSQDASCAAAIVEACSRARSGEGCVLAEPERTVETSRAVAWAWFDGDGQRTLHVNVAASRGPAGTRWRSRQYTFKAEDPPSERCRSAGLIIAGWVSEELDPSGAPLGSTPSQSHEVPGAESLHRPAPPTSLFVNGTFLVGQGVQGGPGRLGLSSLGGYGAVEGPWFASLGLSFARTWRDPREGLSLQWVTMAGGAGLAAPVFALRSLVRLRFEGLLEWTSAEAHGGSRDQASAAVLVPGTRVGLDWVWPREGPIALVAGVEALVRSHPTVVRLGADSVATVSMGSYSGFLGVQVGLDGTRRPTPSAPSE